MENKNQVPTAEAIVMSPHLPAMITSQIRGIKKFLPFLVVLIVLVTTGLYALRSSNFMPSNLLNTTEFSLVQNQNNEVVPVGTASSSTIFESLGNGWRRDKNHVYFHTIETPIDPITVKIISFNYVSDKSGVWTFNEESDVIKLEDADPSSFVMVSPETKSTSTTSANTFYSKDKNHVYYRSALIQGADSTSFTAINHVFSKDKNHIFHGSKALSIALDLNSFSVLDDYTIKDSNGVYYQDEDNEDIYHKLIDADPASYTEVPDASCFVGEEGGNYQYFRDNAHVFAKGKIAEGFDVNTFRGLPTGDFNKDKNHVYFCNDIVEGADSSTFKEISNSGYAKDKNHVYYSSYGFIVVEEADTNTFTAVGGSYGKDKNHIFYDGKLVSEADVITFTLVEKTAPNKQGDYGYRLYGKDKNHVYHLGEIVNGVNPADCTPETSQKCDPY